MANGWLLRTVALAGTAKSRHRHAALVVKDGVLLGQGVARRIGHGPSLSAEAWRCSYLHAEYAAICAAGSAARGATLYVARVNSQGIPRPSEPCARCRGLAQRAGVVRIVWTE